MTDFNALVKQAIDAEASDIHLQGGQAPILRVHRAIDQAVTTDASVTLIVLELAQVTFIPSMGLGLLVQFASKCKARQQSLRLAGVQPKVRQEFCVARLDRLFRFTQTVNEAMT